MTISQRIQNLRKEKNISQEDLAEAAGVSRQAVSKWESATSIPDLDNIIFLSDYFEVTTDYILKGIREANSETRHDPKNNETRRTTSKVFYLSSLFVVLIGFIAGILHWTENQMPSDILKGVAIQAVGAFEYFLAMAVSNEKPHKVLTVANSAICLIMPSSILGNLATGYFIAPIPISFAALLATAVIFAGAMSAVWLIARKRK